MSRHPNPKVAPVYVKGVRRHAPTIPYAMVLAGAEDPEGKAPQVYVPPTRGANR